ncbi:MAG: hypothetical protein OXO51_15525 [Gemmatimonadota bacterium]|nr:hypothetical protein [Gemmatimonadota bacterium]
MPTGPNGEKRPADANACARMIVQIATGEIEDTRHKSPEKAEGGRKGGKARSRRLSPERRSEIGRQAAQARWAKEGGSS